MWSLSSEALAPYVTEVHARKGDAVLFCEWVSPAPLEIYSWFGC